MNPHQSNPGQCQWSNNGPLPQCAEEATTRIGGIPLCKEHGDRSGMKPHPVPGVNLDFNGQPFLGPEPINWQARAEELEKEKADWQDARAEGRRECIAILLEMDAETALDEYIGDHPIGDTGDYGSQWKVEELRNLFNADERESITERSEGAYWELRGEMIGVEDALSASQAEVRRLRDALESIQIWSQDALTCTFLDDAPGAFEQIEQECTKALSPAEKGGAE